jgi:hypothetical protein
LKMKKILAPHVFVPRNFYLHVAAVRLTCGETRIFEGVLLVLILMSFPQRLSLLKVGIPDLSHREFRKEGKMSVHDQIH